MNEIGIKRKNMRDKLITANRTFKTLILILQNDCTVLYSFQQESV